MKQWNEIFKKEGKVFTKIHEDLPKIAKIFKKHNVKKVLDLGSGTGRHTVYLAKNGFDIYGFDIAKEGNKIAKQWLNKEGLQANIKVGSVYEKFPYPDNFFDALISVSVIHHAKINQIRKAISEMERVLKPRGLIFIVVRKRKFKNWTKHKIVEKYGFQKTNYEVIADRTYIPTEGGEKGLPHYLFNRQLLRKEFKNFDIQDIWVDVDKRHYCLLAQIKKH